MDSTQVDELYSRFGDRAILSSAELEYSSALTTTDNVGFSEFLNSEAGQETVQKLRQRFEVVKKTSSARYEDLEAYGIKTDNVAFGIEALSVAAPEAEEFDVAAQDLQRRFDFPLDLSKVAQHKARLIAKAVPKLVTTIQEGPRTVLLRGAFSHARSHDNEVLFTFDHPLNARLGLRRRLTFSFQLSYDQLPSAWENRLHEDGVLELAVFGNLVVSTFPETQYHWDILPIAVYLPSRGTGIETGAVVDSEN